MILSYTWLKDYNPEVNWQTREVQMNQCHIIQKEQVLWKKIEARAINICQSRPPPEYVEDSEEDETPLWICKVEYEQGDRLFMTRILLELTTEDLYATSTISKKLAEGVCQVLEMQKVLRL